MENDLDDRLNEGEVRRPLVVVQDLGRWARDAAGAIAHSFIEPGRHLGSVEDADDGRFSRDLDARESRGRLMRVWK